MNPMSAGGDYEFLHFIWEHLVTYSVVPNTVSKNPFSGQYGPLVPELADSWEVSDDQKTWTFKLHPGVKWSDGTRLHLGRRQVLVRALPQPEGRARATPVAACRASSGADDVKKGTTTDLAGVKAPDPLTVTIETTEPNSLLPYNVMDLFILQKSSLRTIDPATMEKNDYFRTPGKAIGTGPFIVSAYSAGQSMELTRNDNYWRAKPKLDGIIRREFKDTTSALLAFEAGEVDYTYVTADEVERANGIASSTVLPGPSGVDLDIVLNPLKQQGLRRQAGPPGVPVRDRPQVDPPERLPHPRPDPAELPVPRSDAQPAGRAHLRLRPREGQVAADRGGRRPLEVG